MRQSRFADYQPQDYWDAIGKASRPGVGDHPGRFSRDKFGDSFYSLPSWSSAPQYTKHIPLNSRVLDIGSGNGLQLGRLTQAGIFAVGCDISLSLLRAAKRNHRSHGMQVCRLVQWDGTHLPFRSSAFDRITTNTVLQHVVDEQALAAIFQEAGRILQADGLLLITELVSPRGVQTAPHLKLRSPNEYLALASGHGFSNVYKHCSLSLFVSLMTLLNLGRKKVRKDARPVPVRAEPLLLGSSPAGNTKRHIRSMGRRMLARLASTLEPIIVFMNLGKHLCGEVELIFMKRGES